MSDDLRTHTFALHLCRENKLAYDILTGLASTWLISDPDTEPFWGQVVAADQRGDEVAEVRLADSELDYVLGDLLLTARWLLHNINHWQECHDEDRVAGFSRALGAVNNCAKAIADSVSVRGLPVN